MRDNLKSFFQKYKHGLLFLYILLYMPWFAYLEKTVTTDFHVVHMVLDDYIPFIEYFIVPYLFWFFYISIGVIYFFLHNVQGFYKLCIFLFTGMTIFLIISTLYPNGAYLRPVTFERDNIFVDAVKLLYASDTNTNLFPSIHVYNTIGIHLAITHCDELKNRHILVNASRIIMVLIIMSTMFLKQHSVFDVITALGLSGIMALVLYIPDLVKGKRTDWNTYF
ncbi:MAG: hypothetical protein RR364_04260 [Lachnospiraceae bacterium]